MPTDTERRERERRESLPHDMATCPLADDISDCNRERGSILATNVAIAATLVRLELLVQAHETYIQQQVGMAKFMSGVSAVLGGTIGFLAARLWR